MKKPTTLWDEQEYRSTLAEAVAHAVNSFYEIDARQYDTWAVGYSGGKDSTTMLSLLAYAFEFGILERPKYLKVQYADTGMELLPLQHAALNVLSCLGALGFQTEVVHPDIDHRFFVYMLGHGIPPPNNGRMRWCTYKLKVIPMSRALDRQEERKTLLLTGVREGESAIRDGHIAAACSRDGGECGQGYMHIKYQDSKQADSHTPILGFRVCHVWDWLTFYAPRPALAFNLFQQAGLSPKQPQNLFQGFDTTTIAEIYGQESDDGQEEPLDARTGCMGCPLVTNPHGAIKPDKMVERAVHIPKYAYLAPVKRLPEVYQMLLRPENRLRKDGTQRLKNGRLPKNPLRLGPILLEVRLQALEQVLAIQAEVNQTAQAQGMPEISLISQEEHSHILELIAANTWPQRWDGNEETGEKLFQREQAAAQRAQAEQEKHSLWAGQIS